jgi:hypothetical protein
MEPDRSSDAVGDDELGEESRDEDSESEEEVACSRVLVLLLFFVLKLRDFRPGLSCVVADSFEVGGLDDESKDIWSFLANFCSADCWMSIVSPLVALDFDMACLSLSSEGDWLRFSLDFERDALCLATDLDRDLCRFGDCDGLSFDLACLCLLLDPERDRLCLSSDLDCVFWSPDVDLDCLRISLDSDAICLCLSLDLDRDFLCLSFDVDSDRF